MAADSLSSISVAQSPSPPSPSPRPTASGLAAESEVDAAGPVTWGIVAGPELTARTRGPSLAEFRGPAAVSKDLWVNTEPAREEAVVEVSCDVTLTERAVAGAGRSVAESDGLAAAAKSPSVENGGGRGGRRRRHADIPSGSCWGHQPSGRLRRRVYVLFEHRPSPLSTPKADSRLSNRQCRRTHPRTRLTSPAGTLLLGWTAVGPPLVWGPSRPRRGHGTAALETRPPLRSQTPPGLDLDFLEVAPFEADQADLTEADAAHIESLFTAMTDGDPVGGSGSKDEIVCAWAADKEE